MKLLDVIAAAVLMSAVGGSATGAFHASSDRFAYTGSVTKYGTLADARAGIRAIAAYEIPDVPARTIDPGGRDAAFFYVSEDSAYAGWQAFIFQTAWYYDLIGYPHSNPNNTTAGFVHLYDERADGIEPPATVTSANGFWIGPGLDTFYLKIEGQNAGYDDALARLWHGPGTGLSGAPGEGVFLDYKLELITTLPAAATLDPLSGYYVYSSTSVSEEPQSVTGGFSGIFQDTTAATAGFYAFDLPLNVNSWAIEQGDGAFTSNFFYSSFGGEIVTELHWDNGSGGHWDVADNWDPRMTPLAGSDVFIDPQIGLRVIGPGTTTTIASLNVGAQTNGTATLQLQNNGTLGVSSAITITERGKVTGLGTLVAFAGIANYGEIDLGNGGLQIVGDVLANLGLVRGSGQIENTLYNVVNGEVRGENDNRVLFTGANNTNAGEINLNGGAVEFTRDLTNEPDGFISGHGTLIVDGGLTNNGTMALSGQAIDVYGDVGNDGPESRVVVSSGSTATFYDDVHSDGELRIGTDCHAAFFGAFSGIGGTVGPGTAHIEGDLRPGNSLAETPFGGNVVFGSGAALEIEFGNLADTPPNDLIVVAGDATLSGTLDLVAVDELQDPSIGQPRWYGDQTRTIITAGGLGGTTFDDYPLAGDELGFGVFLTDGGANGQAITYDEHAVKVDLLQAATGDANGDRRVDFADVWALLTSGKYNVPDPELPIPWPEGDFNHDDLVDFGDVWEMLVSGHYNQGDYTAKTLGPQAGGPTTVPEPSTLVLAMLGAGLLGVGVCRRRRSDVA